jgi:hypothetical protein
VSGPSDDDDYAGGVGGGTTSTSVVDVTTPTANAHGDGVGFGFAGTGYVQASASTSAAASTTQAGVQSATSSSASAVATFDDFFVINAPGYASGTVATVTYRVALSGTAGGGGTFVQGPNGTAGWSGTTFWRSTASVNGIGGVVTESRSDSSNQGLILSGGGQFGVQTYVGRITIGTLIPVLLRVEVSAQSMAGADFFSTSSASSAFESDLDNTFVWAGISELRDGSGALITDFTALSSSIPSFDYRSTAVVPEPGTAVLMLTGVMSLAGVRRRSVEH